MIIVPKSALEQDGDSNEKIAPEVGDTIDLGGVQACVKAIDGDNYSLDVESVNGAAVVKPTEAVDRDDKDDADPKAKLMKAVANYDKRNGLTEDEE